jgi:hypothetical protein
MNHPKFTHFLQQHRRGRYLGAQPESPSTEEDPPLIIIIRIIQRHPLKASDRKEWSLRLQKRRGENKDVPLCKGASIVEVIQLIAAGIIFTTTTTHPDGIVLEGKPKLSVEAHTLL